MLNPLEAEQSAVMQAATNRIASFLSASGQAAASRERRQLVHQQHGEPPRTCSSSSSSSQIRRCPSPSPTAPSAAATPGGGCCCSPSRPPPDPSMRCAAQGFCHNIGKLSMLCYQLHSITRHEPRAKRTYRAPNPSVLHAYRPASTSRPWRQACRSMSFLLQPPARSSLASARAWGREPARAVGGRAPTGRRGPWRRAAAGDRRRRKHTNTERCGYRAGGAAAAGRHARGRGVHLAQHPHGAEAGRQLGARQRAGRSGAGNGETRCHSALVVHVGGMSTRTGLLHSIYWFAVLRPLSCACLIRPQM